VNEVGVSKRRASARARAGPCQAAENRARQDLYFGMREVEFLDDVEAAKVLKTTADRLGATTRARGSDHEFALRKRAFA
jgi:hypothetical protein